MVNKRFMTVTGLAAIPAKILLTGVCFYLVPLYVLSLGSTQSVVGRILMLYGVVMVVVSPLAAAFASTRQRMEWLVGSGLLLSGIGTLLLMAFGYRTGFVATGSAVALCGLVFILATRRRTARAALVSAS